MLYTNLLPQEEKINIEHENWRRITRFFGAGIAASFLIATVLLFSIYLPIAFERRELERALTLEKEASEKSKKGEVARSVQSLEAQMEAIRALASARGSASEIFHDFFTGISGIRISALAIKKDGAFTLTGFARTRKELLDFEASLRASGKVQEIFFPLSNIVQESNINFSVRGTLRSAYRL